LLIAVVIGGVLVLAFIVLMVVLSVLSQWPPGNLGVKDGKLADCPDTPNCVSSRAADAEHRVEPLKFTSTPGDAWARLVRVVTGTRRVTVVDADDVYLHAEFRSAIFGFVDDVEFVLDADNQVIHCRSASRVGHSDMGANRQRIETIRAAWEKGG
jgi:uncharacterized protein (DUF1499 family)